MVFVQHPRRLFATKLVAICVCVSALSACGFQLRGIQEFGFKSLRSEFLPASSFGAELRRSLEASGVHVHTQAPLQSALGQGAVSKDAEVVLQVLQDQREKTVVGLNASGQVREFQLKLRVKFRLRTGLGKELIADTELLATRDISFNETAVLAKEAEEGLLFRNMQSDLVQQMLRRLAAVRPL